MKKVSIIIPVYNMEDWVESGIKCITEQTYENLEIIIIDDGSKDGSYMKCLAEADKDRRIAVFGKNNEGPGAARNLALRKATGDYIYFFDIDDYLEKNAIEKFVRYMENENTDLVVCSFPCLTVKRFSALSKRLTDLNVQAEMHEKIIMSICLCTANAVFKGRLGLSYTRPI